MKKIRAALIGVVLVILVAVIGLWVCDEKDAPESIAGPIAEIAAGAAGRFEDFTYTKTTDGRTEWELHSSQAEMFQDKDLAIFKDCNLKFFTEDGRQLGLSGNRGTYHLNTQNVEIEGNIIARSEDGYRLLTNSVRYDAESRQVLTDDPVLFFGDSVNVQGSGLRILVDDQKLTLLGPVHAMAWQLEEDFSEKVKTGDSQ